MTLGHVYRESNYCTDFLAKSGSAGDDSFVTLLEAPHDMSSLLLADVLETSVLRS